MNCKCRSLVIFCILILLLVSGCDGIKLFWHPEGPTNPFLGTWVLKNSINVNPPDPEITFSETTFSCRGGVTNFNAPYSDSGSVTYSGNSAKLVSPTNYFSYPNGWTGSAQIIKGKLALSLPNMMISGTYERQ